MQCNFVQTGAVATFFLIKYLTIVATQPNTIHRVWFRSAVFGILLTCYLKQMSQHSNKCWIVKSFLSSLQRTKPTARIGRNTRRQTEALRVPDGHYKHPPTPQKERSQAGTYQTSWELSISWPWPLVLDCLHIFAPKKGGHPSRTTGSCTHIDSTLCLH